MFVKQKRIIKKNEKLDKHNSFNKVNTTNFDNAKIPTSQAAIIK